LNACLAQDLAQDDAVVGAEHRQPSNPFWDGVPTQAYQ
jgi:hypothetical protein